MAALFGSKTPPLPEPTPMADEDAIKKAKQKTAMRLRTMGGRESTILGSADKLGG